MGIDTTKIRSSRSTGILLAPSGIFVTYNSSSALMKWRYKSEMRVKALIWSVICQQRLSSQFRHEDVHGLILGNSMDLAYQILTSTGGRKHDFFMLDGSYEHFLYLTNNHQGEVILALLCDPVKLRSWTAFCSKVLLRGSPDWLLSMTVFHRMAHQSCLAISAICPVSHASTPPSNYPSAQAH